MNDFYFSGIHAAYQHTAFAKIGNLFEKCAKGCSSLVVHKRIGDQTYTQAQRLHTKTEFDIFCKPVKAEATRL